MHSFLIGIGIIATIQYGPFLPPPTPPTAETLIERAFGAMAPVMEAIAHCESHTQQYNERGGPLENPATHDIGLFQINPIWFNTFASMGTSIYTLEGNVRAAKHILETQGLKAWRSSLACWSKITDN